MRVLAAEVVILVVGLERLQVVSLLGVLPLVLNMGMGGVVALRWRGGTVHGLPFVVLVLLQLERVGSLVVATMLEFVDAALIGGMFWIVLTPIWSKWPSIGLTLLVLTPVLSRLSHMFWLFEAYDRRQGVVLKSRPGGDKEVHHLWGQWVRVCAVRR
jgi:hypothetical protein